MDFKGQRLAEWLGSGILVVAAIIGWILGFRAQDLKLTAEIFGAGVALSALVRRCRQRSLHACAHTLLPSHDTALLFLGMFLTALVSCPLQIPSETAPLPPPREDCDPRLALLQPEQGPVAQA